MGDITIFEIDGNPVGKGRPRFHNGRVLTPKHTREWEKLAALAIKLVWRNREPIKGACSVRIESYKARPKGRPALASPDAWASGEAIPAPVKPDADNVAKALLDALVKGRVIEDDALVVHLEIWTYWCAKDGTPKVIARVEHL